MPALARRSNRPATPRHPRTSALPEERGQEATGARAVIWSLLHLAGAAIFVALMLARMAQAAAPPPSLSSDAATAPQAQTLAAASR